MVYHIKTKRLNGNEQFCGIDCTLLDYWQWAHSDIAANAERGKLAEFIVKCSVNSPSSHRTEWDAVDVVSSDGIRIEVKSSAYLQTWKTNKYSSIQFDIAPKKSWDGEANLYYDDVGRHSDIYVFCLFACKDPEIANPLNLAQWDFYVIATSTLNEKIPTQKRISLNSLIKLGAIKTQFSEIHTTAQKLIFQSR